MLLSADEPCVDNVQLIVIPALMGISMIIRIYLELWDKGPARQVYSIRRDKTPPLYAACA